VGGESRGEPVCFHIVEFEQFFVHFVLQIFSSNLWLVFSLSCVLFVFLFLFFQ
jgi:hypothetical protein